jgi:hypothetical protein
VVIVIIGYHVLVTLDLSEEDKMPFIKQGIAPILVVKCGCGSTLDSVHSACPTCKKNLRPLGNPEKDEPEKSDKTADKKLDR